MTETVTVDELREKFSRLAQKYDSHRKLAKVLRVSEQYVCDVLKGRRDPSPRIVAWMGYRERPRTFERTEDVTR